MWFIVILVPVLLVLLIVRNRRPPNFPPGPFPLPIIGNLHQMGTRPHINLIKMRETYGDLIALNMGRIKCVVVSDYKMIKEAFNLPAYNGREHIHFMAEPISGQMKGVIHSEGVPWMEQRRFMLRNLRDFGFGRKSMEVLIQEEIVGLIDEFQKDVGKPIVMTTRFNIPVINALWQIVSGQRRDHTDERFIKLVTLMTQVFTNGPKIVGLIVFPIFGRLFPKLSGLTQFKSTIEMIYKYLREVIAEHKSSLSEDTKRDLIDCYLKEIENTTDQNSSFYKLNGELNMANSVFDLFTAGAESVSTTLTWACLYLAKNPEVQEKLNRHIEEVCGTRLPSLTDKPNLPYCEAVIHEVLRTSSIVPMGALHRITEDVEFHGYKLPKDTVMIPNQYGVLHDPKIWGDPEEFRPERFLSKDEKTFIPHEAFIPFSTGKRVCPGESLAKDELFLFISGLIQRFRFGFNPDGPIPSLEAYPSILLLPKPHELVLHDRYEE